LLDEKLMQQNIAHKDLNFTTLKSLHASLTLLEKQVYLAAGGGHRNSKEYDTNLLKELKAVNYAQWDSCSGGRVQKEQGLRTSGRT
jgi:S-adenosylmethionine:diacylglycerol 3-amino-3-carboxypropyl transferase